MAVILTTNHGTIKLELDAEKAPKTVENFLAYVQAGHYNGTIFHRVIDDRQRVEPRTLSQQRVI